MRRLGFLFCLLLLFVSSVSAKISVTDAQKIVKEYVEKKTTWNYNNIKIYRAPSQVKRVDIAFNQSFTINEASWCFMIDPSPNLKWCHSCKYICVSPITGLATIKSKNMFPEDFDKWIVIKNPATLTRADNPSAHFISPRLFKQYKTNVIKNNGHAVLISGGETIGGNWQDGWNEISIMYQALVDLQGYRKENITVLMADGTDPAADMTVGDEEISSPLDLDGDGNSDINYACKPTNVKTVFDSLAKITNTNDDIFVYMVSHGNYDLIALYGIDQYLYAQDLNKYLNNLKAKSITVFVSACHSGSFVDDLRGPNRTIITNTSKDEQANIYSDICEIGIFWGPFFSALTKTDLKSGRKLLYDLNGDGENDYEESFAWGIMNDRNATIDYLGKDYHETPNFWTSKPISRTVNITSGSGRIMSGDVITASNKISNADIVYQSEKKILLKKGFKFTKSGRSKFKGLVGGNCLRSLDIPVDLEEDEFFEYEGITDIDDAISEIEGVEIYPNPTDGLLYIRANSAIKKLIVTDLTGKVILDANGGSTEETLDLSSNAQGFYLLHIITEDDSYVEKIMLK